MGGVFEVFVAELGFLYPTFESVGFVSVSSLHDGEGVVVIPPLHCVDFSSGLP